jgi:large conductance mechanosensitive channel
MLREFKEFIARGNVLGLAVAVVLGAAFGVVVSSFVKDILMQLIAALGATPSFDDLSFTLNGAEIRYGAFLNAVVMFLIVSFVMFLVVKGYNRIVREKEKEAPPAKESELELLRQIRDVLASRRIEV